uniref:RNA-binding protein MEX3B-like n=1 Tax=Sinocyclocheilus rhinocerous TaxID=307959 RepID=A0A673GSM7_9TELE
MPSLLVLAGIMEKNGGYGGDLAGFGSEGLLVPPEDVEDDSRALRVALGQLSLLGLGEGEDGAPAGGGGGVQDRSNNNHHNHIPAESGMLQGKNKLCALYDSSPTETKGRGCNITECVPVPSSEHVAEIVGRQGKYNDAHFHMLSNSFSRVREGRFSGRRESVLPAVSARQSIQVIFLASQNKYYLTDISYTAIIILLLHSTGCKIKALRAKTNTYIKTPVRGEEPVFLITGRKEDVALARREIISTTIQVRVPYRVVNDCLGPDSGNGGLESRLQQVWGLQGAPRKPLASSFRQNFSDAMVGSSGGGGSGIYSKGDFTNHGSGDKPCSYFGSEGTQSWGDPEYPKQVAYYAQQRSKSFGGLPLPLTRLSPGLPEPCGTGNSNAVGSPHAQARRAHSEPTTPTAITFTGRLPVPDSPPAVARDCMTCFESKVTAALVPCGHNLFCMECAIRICELNHPECPVCHTLVTQAIRIFS